MQDNDLQKTIDIIGYDSGWGCGDFRCEDGPHKIEHDRMIAALAKAGLSAHWTGPLGLRHLGQHLKSDLKEDTLPYLLTGLKRLYHKTFDSIEKGRVPLVIGGDHSSAIGTWSAVTAATRSHGHFGLIWIDAHLDCHTVETSWQGKFGGWWHGQPVAALCGRGLPGLKNIGGTMEKISPAHISMIGTHSFEPAEEEFVKKHNIRVFTLDEVKKRGFQSVFSEALARATNGTKGFGMSIDLDVFHPLDAPGVGAAEEDGIEAKDVLPVLRGIGRHAKFRALEIAEYNPHKDVGQVTAGLVCRIAESVFAESDV